jgi:hypothetical protein
LPLFLVRVVDLAAVVRWTGRRWKPTLPIISKSPAANTTPFKDTAITAIHQGAGGIYRTANHLAPD